MMEHLNPQAYESFHAECSPEEWARLEPKFLAALPNQWTQTRISIHLVRNEYEQAVRLLADVPYDHWVSDTVLKAASQLETRFPLEVLSFYRSGIGPTDRTAPRGEYARWAHIAAKMRHIWMDVMRKPDLWIAFLRELKAQSERRPAMREESAKVLHDWDTV